MKNEQYNAILSQLAIGTVQSIGWISDGSSSKVYTGTLVDCTSCKRGLRLAIDTGLRIVNVTWRMGESDAVQIVDAYDAMRIVEVCRSGLMLNARGIDDTTVYDRDCTLLAAVTGHACVLSAV